MKIIVFQGGLGNQIFQYRFLEYIKLNTKKDVYGYYKLCRFSHNGLVIHKFLDVSLPKENWFVDMVFIILNFLKRRGINLFYSTDSKLNINDIVFDGFWQDKKFNFDGSSKLEFRPIELNVNNKLIFNNLAGQEYSVSIHVRRADYLSEQFVNIYGNICTLEYYVKAIKIVKMRFNNPFFYIFSDDIEWVKEKFKLENSQIISWNNGEYSFIDMYLMSLCKVNIIANSSFSYWAASLNKINLLTIYPKKWYNSKYLPPDIFPDIWLGI